MADKVEKYVAEASCIRNQITIKETAAYIYELEANLAAARRVLKTADKVLERGATEVGAFLECVKVGQLNSAAERQLTAIYDDFLTIVPEARALIAKVLK